MTGKLNYHIPNRVTVRSSVAEDMVLSTDVNPCPCKLLYYPWIWSTRGTIPHLHHLEVVYSNKSFNLRLQCQTYFGYSVVGAMCRDSGNELGNDIAKSTTPYRAVNLQSPAHRPWHFTEKPPPYIKLIQSMMIGDGIQRPRVDSCLYSVHYFQSPH